MVNFKSDNITAVTPEIMDAIVRANTGFQSPYGNDEYSLRLKTLFSDIFEKDVEVYLTNTGTASNSLALASLVTSYATTYCHQTAHINVNECGAPLFFTGSSLTPIQGINGKINPVDLIDTIETALQMGVHTQPPGCISLTQATEYGTLYTLQELKVIFGIGKKYNIPIHMDGARFANALVALECAPCEITWKVGVDVLSFGATKNGAMMAEAIVFFNKEYAKNFQYLHKRGAQLMSKTRFVAVQFLAYLEKGLWLKNATHANTMTRELADVFRKYGIKIQYPVETNQLFVRLPSFILNSLKKAGVEFYAWDSPVHETYRFVTSCFTDKNDIESLDLILSNMIK